MDFPLPHAAPGTIFASPKLVLDVDGPFLSILGLNLGPLVVLGVNQHSLEKCGPERYGKKLR